MANPYYVTYTFREEVLPSGDLARLKIKFRINTSGDDSEVVAATEDCYVNNYGSLEWNYDFENFLLVPGFLDLKLAIPKDSIFEKWFFGISHSISFHWLFAEKDAEVLLEIKYQGDDDYTVEFKGYVVDNSIDYDPDKGILTFTAAPRTDILNRQMLYDLDDDPINPFTYSVPHSEGTFLYNIQRIIEDCYKLINPSVEVVFDHGWLFLGYITELTVDENGRIALPASFTGSWGSFLNDFNFSELWEDIRPLFFDQSKGLVTIGDVLRKLAMDWFAITGMLHQDKAFFKKLFSPSNSYALSDETYYVYNKAYKLPLIKYVHYKIPNGIVYEQGVFTELQGQYIQRDSLVGWFDTGSSRFTNVLAVRESGAYDVYEIVKGRDPDLSIGNSDYGNLIAPLWFNYRGDHTKCRIDPIVTPGINHSILNTPIFQGRTYQPIRLKKLFMEGKTEIDGLLISY